MNKLIKDFVFESQKPYSKKFSNNILIESIHSKNDFKKFYYFPWKIYTATSLWVPPLWSEYTSFFNMNNPFWTHTETQLFLAKQNNNTVGRIAVFIDRLYNKHYRNDTGFFGFFESINDTTVSSALFSTAQSWLQSKGCKKIIGPINGRIDVGCGVLIDGFDSPPSLQSSYNPLYYQQLIENEGMKKNRDLLDYYIDLNKPLPESLKLKAEQAQKNGFTVRPLKRFKLHKEFKWWVAIFLEAFDNHWGYVPTDKTEVMTRFGVKQLRWFVDPRLFLVVEKDAKPMGFIWAMPEYNEVFKTFNGRLGFREILRFYRYKHQYSLGKLHLIGMYKAMRKHHIASLLNYQVLLEMQSRGYDGAVCGWLDEGNVSAHQTIRLTNPQVYKRYRVYELEI